MDQEKGLVLHHVSLADNYNLDKAGDFLTQLHLATGLTDDKVANAEVLKNLNLQDEDATIKQFVFQGQCMILGDTGAGKTSLVNSLTGKPFDPSQTKTRKIEQKLVDEDWKNLGMTDLLLGNLWWFCQRIRVQLTLYGPARRQNIFLRILDDWRNVFLEVNTMGPIHYICVVVGLCHIVDVIGKAPLISPLLLLIVSIVLLYIVFLYLFNNNYTFRLIVTTFAFTVRTRGLLIGSFSALTLVCYHYGKISLDVSGFVLIILTLGLAVVVLILSGLGITLQYPYPRQMKFKYQRSLTIACFMPFLLSVLVGLVTFNVLAILLINYWTGLGLRIKNPHEFVQNLVSVFGFWWTMGLLKSAYTYIKILFKWPSIGILKVAVTCTLTAIVFIFLFIQLINMYWYLSFGSIIFLIFLCDSLFREWLNMQELGIEGNKFTAVVIEKQELHKERLKVALHKKFSSIKLRILDFPGEEEYYAYYQIFLRRKAFYVIVFNMMDFAGNDFNETDAKCNRLQFWFETVCSHVPPKTPIFLVGTQRRDMDRNNITRLDTQLKRCLWRTNRDELVVNDTEGLIFFPIENSKAKEESGVQVLQERINTAAQKVKETFGREIPLSWVRVQDAIISLKEKKGAKFCLRLEEFSNVLDNFDNFSSTNWSKEMLQYFHETGLVIYLQRDQDLDLSNWILLKPEILVDIIIQLVTPPLPINQERGLRHDWDLLKEKGLLTKSLLENIISNVKENMEAMTAFLEEYDLICPLANSRVNMFRVCEGEEQPTHFVPSLLPMASERDTPIWYDDNTDKKCYVFFTKFLPQPLFHHLLSRAHKLTRVEFPNGHTVIFRDSGRFWLTSWQPYSIKLMKEEKMIEVTFRCRENDEVRPSDVLCHVFSMVDGICKTNFPFVSFHCGPACPSSNCPGYQPNYVSLSVGEEQVRRQHVFNVMPAGRQGDRIPFMYCEDHSFERELNEWIP